MQSRKTDFSFHEETENHCLFCSFLSIIESFIHPQYKELLYFRGRNFQKVRATSTKTVNGGKNKDLVLNTFSRDLQHQKKSVIGKRHQQKFCIFLLLNTKQAILQQKLNLGYFNQSVGISYLALKSLNSFKNCISKQLFTSLSYYNHRCGDYLVFIL